MLMTQEKPPYFQRKADVWNRIKAIEPEPTIAYTAPLAELEAHLAGLPAATASPFKSDYCAGNCEKDATKHIRFMDKWGFSLKPFGSPKIPYFVQGPLITFCPFCGRRLKEGK